MLPLKTATDLKKGDKGIIYGFKSDEIALKLLELGCVPGKEITRVRYEPYNGPSYLKINGSNIALRHSEVENILISSGSIPSNETE